MGFGLLARNMIFMQGIYTSSLGVGVVGVAGVEGMNGLPDSVLGRGELLPNEVLEGVRR